MKINFTLFFVQKGETSPRSHFLKLLPQLGVLWAKQSIKSAEFPVGGGDGYQEPRYEV